MKRLGCRDFKSRDFAFFRKVKLILMFLVVGGMPCFATESISQFPVGNKAVSNLQQSSHTVRGYVADAQNQPIVGATVHIKGTNRGTITDVQGKYSLDVNEGDILVYSFVGMKPREITYHGQKNIDMVMEDNAIGLDQVVVIGYGKVQKRDLTGAVASIRGQELSKIPISDPAQALSGRLSGVQVTPADGTPGSEVVIRVRGGGSITGDNSPLIIVDGFPVSSMNEISPTDIESVDVLKDASATAIYGSQGANGVILISTKSAKAGTTQVVYDGFVQTKSINRRIDVLNTYQYVLLNYEYAAMRGESDVLSFEKNYGVWDDLHLYKEVKGTNWQDQFFGADLLSNQQSLSVRGGTKRTKFTFSTVYNKNNGLLKTSNYKRIYANFKMEHQLFKGLKFDLNVRVTDYTKNGSGTSGDVKVRDVLTRGPVEDLQEFVDVDPTEMTEEEYQNYLNNHLSLADRAAQNWRQKTGKKYSFMGGLTWDVVRGLTYRLEGGYTSRFNQDKRYYGELTSKAKGMAGLPVIDWTKTEAVGVRQAQTLTCVFDIKKNHRFNILAGEELNTSSEKYSFIEASHFNADLPVEKVFANIQLTDGLPDISSYEDDEYRRLSFFGRLMYNLKGKYYLTGTFRADGSSKFPTANRWGYFPAGSIAWRVSEESFMKSAKDWLSNLKIRFSYGEAGNDKVKADLWKQDYAVTTKNAYSEDKNLNAYYTAENTELPNPKLKWETTITRNIGLDFGFFQERISGSIDAFKNTARDLLVKRSIVAPGYTTMVQNVGAMSNNGIELSLSARIIDKRDYSLSFDFNIGHNKSKVDRLAKGVTEQFYDAVTNYGYDDYVIRVGEPVGLFYGFISDGYYTVDDFQSYDKSSGDYIVKDGVAVFDRLKSYLRPGSAKFKDINKDGAIDAEDKKVIGRADPDFYGGFGINSRYKGFDLSVLCSYMVGNKVYNATKLATAQRYGRDVSNQLAINNINNRFTYLNEETGALVTDLEELRVLNAGKKMWSPMSFDRNSLYTSSWAIEDGSFLRIQNITMGYTVPQSISKKAGIQKFRLYATVTNPWIFTNYSGYDPEVSSSKNQVLMPNLDWSSYPRSVSWTFGVNVTF